MTKLRQLVILAMPLICLAACGGSKSPDTPDTGPAPSEKVIKVEIYGATPNHMKPVIKGRGGYKLGDTIEFSYNGTIKDENNNVINPIIHIQGKGFIRLWYKSLNRQGQYLGR